MGPMLMRQSHLDRCRWRATRAEQHDAGAASGSAVARITVPSLQAAGRGSETIPPVVNYVAALDPGHAVRPTSWAKRALGVK